jgi:hypothetical protein
MTTKKKTIASPSIVENESSIFKDIFRQNLGAWLPTSEGLQYEERDRLDLKVSSDFQVERVDDDLFVYTKETLTIRPNGRIIDFDEWQKNIELAINTELEFEDYITTFDLPLTLDEAKFVQNNTKVLNSDFQFNYPFEEYEELVNEGETFETFITSYYELALKAQADEHFAHLINGDTVLNLTKANLGRGVDLSRRQPTRLEREAERAGYRNQIFPSENLELLFNYNTYLAAFPMYNRLSLKTDASTTNMMDALQDTKLGTLFSRWLTQFLFMSEPVVESEQNGDEVENSTIRRTVVDFLEWWKNRAPSLLGDLPDSFSYVDSGTAESVDIANTENPIALALALRQIRNKINEAFRNHQRSYSEILSGKKSINETLMYRVAKFKGVPSGTPIQNYYIPNIDEIDVLDFIDTQVKYDQEYSYLVYAEKMVIGSKYQYEALTFEREPRSTLRAAKLRVDIFPTFKIVEVPLITITGRILATPPVYPEINIVPFKGVKDRLLFHFQTNTNRLHEVPVILQDSDRGFFDNLQASHNLPAGAPVEFETFLEASRFEIYRTTKPPQNYNDFKDSLLTTITTDVDATTKLKASSAAYKMSLKPNTKYYLTFRTIDRNGGLSNPSPIYQVELFHESGVSYPLIQEYQFSDIDKSKMTSKAMNRMVLISPRITQIFLNEKESGLKQNGLLVDSAKNKNIKLGLQEDALIEKRFKIRITSRLTGKKVDVNIDFKQKHNVTEFERDI